MSKSLSLPLTFALLLMMGCTPSIWVQEEAVKYKGKRYLIGESTINEVISDFGNDFTIKDWNGFSYEYFFKSKPISFSYEQDNPRKTVRWINIAATEKIWLAEDFILNKSTTVEDIVNRFGQADYNYDSTYAGLTLEYDNFDIIIKTTESDLKFLKSSDLEYQTSSIFYSRFNNHRIKGIEVY